MRKKMLLLVLSLAALAGSLTAHAATDNGGIHACPQCITYSNGSQCCVSCICDSSNLAIACTNNYCPPDGGGID